MKWFVYSNASYYPDAVIAEADTVEQVCEWLADAGYPSVTEGLAIFPLDALALWTSQAGGEETIEQALTVYE